MDEIIDVLEKSLKRFERERISYNQVEESVPIFNRFNEDILKCYRLQSFYGSNKLEGKRI